jgi:hypothetical protein
MKRPSFQFYPADFRNNSKLRRCSPAARGAWVDIMCVLHDSDEYGVCRWPLVELAQSAGVPIKLARELSAKDVLKGADEAASDYVFTPRHANKDGEPVTLVVAGEGPCWYCSRFVRDEYVRQRRGQSTRYSSDNQPPKHAPGGAPMTSPMPPFGDPQGDGASSTSSSTSNSKGQLPMSSGDDVRECPYGTLANLYHDLMPLNPKMKVLNAARKSAMKARWNEAAKLDCEPFGYTTQAAGLEAWRQFFIVCAESKFLTGLAPAATGKPAFVADIDFLFSPSGFAKTLENKYHRDAL